RKLLGIVQTLRNLRAIEDHRRCHHGTRQRPAPRLVDAGDETIDPFQHTRFEDVVRHRPTLTVRFGQKSERSVHDSSYAHALRLITSWAVASRKRYRRR